MYDTTVILCVSGKADVIEFIEAEHQKLWQARCEQKCSMNQKRTNEGQISTKVVMKMHENSFSIMNMTTFLYLTLQINATSLHYI